MYPEKEVPGLQKLPRIHGSLIESRRGGPTHHLSSQYLLQDCRTGPG